MARDLIKKQATKVTTDEMLEEQIRRRAYEIYEAAGKTATTLTIGSAPKRRSRAA